jgi:hypothetical protein
MKRAYGIQQYFGCHAGASLRTTNVSSEAVLRAQNSSDFRIHRLFQQEKCEYRQYNAQWLFCTSITAFSMRSILSVIALLQAMQYAMVNYFFAQALLQLHISSHFNKINSIVI